MKKSNLPKVGTIIPPIMLAGSIISSNLQQALVEKLILFPFETPEQHCEEFPPFDYFGLNRVNGIFSATGTNPVMVFGENKSKLYSY
jgi:hypothetical protein